MQLQTALKIKNPQANQSKEREVINHQSLDA